MNMSETLRKAREFEEEVRGSIDPLRRPVYHLTGIKGWINDPNGLSLYGDDVHLFYQANPYAVTHGPMHWGHATTKDFIRWTYRPTALAPDMPYDRNGCFSGTALTMPDGAHLLMYTGVDEEGDSPQTHRQTQCIATGDGTDYSKYAGNPVIDSSLLPEGASPIDFRDPKIWEENGRYYCIAVNRVADGSGAVLLFSGEDPFHWQYRGILAQSAFAWGDMWECPDLLRLDGADALVLSAAGIKEQEVLPPGYTTFAMIGSFDPEAASFATDRVQALDEGIDFYAPQTLRMPDGRHIMIGWMQNWETVSQFPDDIDFHGQMAVPREITIEEGRIMQRPVRELGLYRRNQKRYCDIEVSKDLELEGIGGRVLDLELVIRPQKEGYERFSVAVAAHGSFCTTITYDRRAGRIRVDRTDSGMGPCAIHERSFPCMERGGALRLRLLLDRYSLELFVNDGEHAATFLLYAPSEAEGIRFSADGCARIDIDQYELER